MREENTGEKVADGITWINKSDGGPHEANYLKLDCTRIKQKLSWNPVWDINRAMKELVGWYYAYGTGGDVLTVTKQQIEEYIFDYTHQ